MKRLLLTRRVSALRFYAIAFVVATALSRRADGQALRTFDHLSQQIDVSISGSPSGKVLKHNGTKWADATLTLSDISGLTSALAGKQATITLGTISQYFDGTLALRTFPTALSSFTNDTNFITSAGAPVQSVNTQTGAVVLTLAANTSATSHQFFTAYNSTTGAFTKAQPAIADLSDAGNLASWAAITTASKQAALTTGTTAQYFKGDLSLGTLNQAAVAGLTTSDSPSFTGLTASGGTINGSGSTLILNGGSGDAVSSTAFTATNGYFKSPSGVNLTLYTGSSSGNLAFAPGTAIRGTLFAAGGLYLGTGAQTDPGTGNLTVSGGTIKNGTVIWKVGSGSPEGVVTAAIGSFYSRADGGAGTTLYVKESGAGNTGWVGK